jgi:3-keto-disaccharide hydrolase
MTHTAAAYLSCWSIALLAGCNSPKRQTPDTSSQASSQGGSVVASAGDSAGSSWRSLFDGKTTAGWRGYRSQKVPDGWRVEDGTLTRVSSGGDLVTNDTFRDFELTLEWKIAPGGNSGIMYRVTEDAEKPYETGPEMQVLDDAKHPDGKSRLTSAGALYGLYPSPAGVVKPAGEWNAVRVVVNGNHVEHWLNGVKVAEAEMGSPDWNARVAASKFKEWPGYGKAREGHIVLQDHGDVVAYRNIRIKTL